jgi:2-methylcitrate dehydratase PrpD
MDQNEVILLISSRLAGFIENICFERLSHAAVQAAKLAFLDWLGSAAAGGLQEPSQRMLAVLRNQGGGLPRQHYWQPGRRLPV